MCPYVIKGLFFNLHAWHCREYTRLSQTFLWVEVSACDNTTVVEQTGEHHFSLKQLRNTVIWAVVDSLLLPEREDMIPPHASPVSLPLFLPCSQRCDSAIFPGLALVLNPCRACVCLVTWQKTPLFPARAAFSQVSEIRPSNRSVQCQSWCKVEEGARRQEGGEGCTPPCASAPPFNKLLGPSEDRGVAFPRKTWYLTFAID